MRKVGTIRDMTRAEIIEARFRRCGPTTLHGPLVMAWAFFIGFVMFVISAGFYPCMGSPPAWLIFPMLAASFYCLCEITWGD